jgi:subfamily B ATP-binding cassette protein MsbA
VGTTGGGKSTVVSLIPRFYDPTSGYVRIDGVDIREYQLHPLRSQIGFVLQDTVLFRGTIRDNIAYGRLGATQKEIEEAAQLANANEFISRIRNTPLLILDEPTAALDTESERLVIEALERLMKGRTVITIAHRLSTIRDADKIIVLKAGMVAEQGTHEELLALGGVYAALHHTQVEGMSEKVGT